jgi:hypothetical protein
VRLPSFGCVVERGRNYCVSQDVLMKHVLGALNHFLLRIDGVYVNRMRGFVYLILNASLRQAKIGYSAHPLRRIVALQTSVPHHLTLMHWFPGTRETERHLHERFDSYHLGREWFYAHDEILEYFKNQELAAVPKPKHNPAPVVVLNEDAGRLLGPHRGAALIYGFLFKAGASVEASYKDLMTITGTESAGSIIRWIRLLEETHYPCIASRCSQPHPLLVVKRRGRENLYRKWHCGQDEFVARKRTSSVALRLAAQRRIAKSRGSVSIVGLADGIEVQG